MTIMAPVDGEAKFLGAKGSFAKRERSSFGSSSSYDFKANQAGH